MTQETTAVAVANKSTIEVGGRGLVLRNLDEMFRFSAGVVKSGLAPSSFKTPEAVMIAIQYGAEVGLSPMQSLQSLAVINGKPSLYGDALPALAWGSGLLESLEETHEGAGDSRQAVCVLVRKGVLNPIRRTFSVADAKKASLWGKPGPWSSYPDRMLSMRARAFAFRDGFADVLRGLHVAEEVADYEPPKSTASVPYTLPTETPPNVIETTIVQAGLSEDVKTWLGFIAACKDEDGLTRLHAEFDEARDGRAQADVEAIEAAFASRLDVLTKGSR